MTSLRVRLLLIGVTGVAVALAAGGVVLYAALQVIGFRTLDASARTTATDVADLVLQDRLPDPLPVAGTQVVQVLDERFRVVSASSSADRLTALLAPAEVRRAEAEGHVVVSGSRAGLASRLRVVVRTTHTSGSDGAARVVVVGQGFAPLERSQRTLASGLLLGLPLLLGLLALILWRAVGAALTPVESLRSSADRISGSGGDVRLPVPANHDEIGALAVTLNAMLDRLAGARARQRDFVADAAHELRSPLASLQAQLDVAHRLGGVEREDLADLRAEVTRMTTLVGDLLLLARVDAEPSGSPAEPLEVVALVVEVVGRYDAARVPVVLLAPGSEALVAAGADELRRALANLLDNAVRHAAARVEVRIMSTGAEVVVEVADDGAGVPQADRARVLERFTRLDEGRARDQGGSGLGLAIVTGLAARHGGRLELGESAAGGLSARLVLRPAG